MDYLDYGGISLLATLRERPCSDQFSFAFSIDDTFSFIRQQPRRKRVDVAPQTSTSASQGTRRCIPVVI